MNLQNAELTYYEENYFGYVYDENGIFADFYRCNGINTVNSFKKYIDCEYIDVEPTEEEITMMFNLLDSTPPQAIDEEEETAPKDLYFENGVKPEYFY